MKKYIFAIVFISNLFAQVDYSTQIQTIFTNSCTSCHMYGNANGGLNLQSYGGVMTNSNSGASVVPEDHANSYLWQRVNNGEMPPGNNPDLSADQINLIAQWIDEGALETPAVEFQPQSYIEFQIAVNLFVSDSASALSTYGEINTWDVSLITDMTGSFFGATSFNSDISAWDVSSVTEMGAMFNGATSFNGDISAWDVSSVTEMGAMFNGASSFNGDISAWDVSNVTDMTAMFQNCSVFDSDLSTWDVSSVTEMGAMFNGATSFNSDISAWDVSSVTEMFGIFESNALSDENKCAIHNSWSIQSTVWYYNWSTFCALSTDVNSLFSDNFTLHQNYPNPFNPVTSLRYDLPQDGLVNITIYDMMGRQVKTLVNSSQTAGYKSIRWNATNNAGASVSAGLYFYTIQAGKFTKTSKMLLLK